MNSQVKDKWISALRSGEYQQGESKLRSSNGFCCLGVLCDIYAKENNNEWQFRGYTEYSEEENPQPLDYWCFGADSEFLPYFVMEWAELDSNNPPVKVDVDAEDEDEDEWSFTDEIANLNDSGYTFAELATIIEEQL